MVHRLLPLVRTTLSRLLESRPLDCALDRDDLTQLTLEQLMRAPVIDGLRGKRSLSDLAARATANVIQQYQRTSRQERQAMAACQNEVRSSASPSLLGLQAERRLLARAELHKLTQTLGRMRDKDARALVLHRGLGYSLSETAAALGCSELATQTRLVRAARELRRRTAARRADD